MYIKTWVIIMLSTMLLSCSSLQSLLESAPKPGANIVGVKLSGLDLQQANLVFDIDISNPYSVPLPLTNLDYSLATNGKSFLSGNAKELQGSIPASGNKVIQLPVSIKFLETLNVLSGFKPGSVVPYTAKMDLSVDAPGVGPISLPLQKEAELPIPTAPDVNLESVDWQDIGFSKATATLNVRLKNNNEFPLDLNKLNYALKLSDTSVVENKIEKSTSFAKGEENIVKIPISILPSNLGFALFNMLKGSGSSYGLEGSMDVQTPFGPLNLPLSGSGNTKFNH
ncbi:LEA type 2 family protein [Candidatus Uabimicrobium sp. HlEnr_7]|uniref:LEA type 2 family protein n=1 Tax=Candidatus Uabimicrobium helgolandensis TaxID=3095367 RepID=UPI0035562F17